MTSHKIFWRENHHVSKKLWREKTCYMGVVLLLIGLGLRLGLELGLWIKFRDSLYETSAEISPLFLLKKFYENI